MIQQKLIGFLVFIHTLLCNCYTEPVSSPFLNNKREYEVNAYARFPEGFKESSGLAQAEGGTFLTVQDGGNASWIYNFDATGNIIDTIQLKLPNVDWEGLAKDKKGNIFIGDFGNNLSNRQNLRIFILQAQSGQIDTLHFSYPGQQEFPPVRRKDRNYDCEAFIWYNGNLHLFSKSYGDKEVIHYILPDTPGHYVATPVEKIKLKGLITGAAVRPDGQQLALLSYGRIYLFSLKAGTEFFQSPYKCINLAGYAQTEGIVYVGENLLISNEQGRLIYVYKR